MRNKIISALCLLTFSTALYSEECDAGCKRYCCTGKSSAYGSTYSVGSSMLTWGALLFLGIGLVSAFIDPSIVTAHHDSSNDSTNTN